MAVPDSTFCLKGRLSREEGCDGSQLVFFFKLSLPPVGTPSQVGWPAENQKPKHPSWSCPPSAPPLLFPGPMEGQAVPTEPCQGCALTPTIHPNPPPLHPFPLFPPQPWHSACQPQPCLLLALPRPPSPLPKQSWGLARALQSTVTRPGTCCSDAEPGTEAQSLAQPILPMEPLPHPCPLLWDLLLGAKGLGT